MKLQSALAVVQELELAVGLELELVVVPEPVLADLFDFGLVMVLECSELPGGLRQGAACST